MDDVKKLLIRLPPEGRIFPHAEGIYGGLAFLNVIASDLSGPGASRSEILDLYSFRRNILMSKDGRDPRIDDIDFLVQQLLTYGDSRCQLVQIEMRNEQYAIFFSFDFSRVLGCIKLDSPQNIEGE